MERRDRSSREGAGVTSNQQNYSDDADGCVALYGVVRDLNWHSNSRGEPWVDFLLEAPTSSTEAVMFPRRLALLPLPILYEGSEAFVRGRIALPPGPSVHVTCMLPIGFPSGFYNRAALLA